MMRHDEDGGIARMGSVNEMKKCVESEGCSNRMDFVMDRGYLVVYHNCGD